MTASLVYKLLNLGFVSMLDFGRLAFISGEGVPLCFFFLFPFSFRP